MNWSNGLSDFFAVIFFSVLRMAKNNPVLHRKSKPKTYFNINEGQATSFPRTLHAHTWCEWQTTWIVFINTDTQYFDMSLVLGIRPTVFDHLSARYAANLQQQAIGSNDAYTSLPPPHPPPPHFNDAKKMARFGFRKKELIIESGEGWFCFSFYPNQGCSMEGNLLPFVCLRHR